MYFKNSKAWVIIVISTVFVINHQTQANGQKIPEIRAKENLAYIWYAIIAVMNAGALYIQCDDFFTHMSAILF